MYLTFLLRSLMVKPTSREAAGLALQFGLTTLTRMLKSTGAVGSHTTSSWDQIKDMTSGMTWTSLQSLMLLMVISHWKIFTRRQMEDNSNTGMFIMPMVLFNKEVHTVESWRETTIREGHSYWHVAGSWVVKSLVLTGLETIMMISRSLRARSLWSCKTQLLDNFSVVPTFLDSWENILTTLMKW